MLLVETDNGLVLIDSGFGAHDCVDPGRRVGPTRNVVRSLFDQAETAAHQIERLGFRRDDVGHIVVTHLDVDHIGGLSDFPDAQIHVTAAEALDAIRSPSWREKLRYRPSQWAHQPNIVEHHPHGEAWGGFAAAKELTDISPGIALISLHTERRDPAQRTTEQSLTNFRNVLRISAAQYGLDSGLTTDEIITESHRYGNHLGVELGNWYQSAAVIPDGTTPPSVDDDYSDYAPSAVPGCRAPHIPLGPHGAVSTLDLFANSFTVLAGPDRRGWVGAAERLRATGTPVVGYRVGAPGLDDDGRFLHTYDIESDGAVLVRPDGYVGWRSASASRADGAELDAALQAILGATRP